MNRFLVITREYKNWYNQEPVDKITIIVVEDEEKEEEI